ncbi:glycoside hydrolase family 108 protein [Methylocella sp.]|uniref:glycoside hydrolase family 108 protein n=1 Tax=Methylocella sp. TaxID=1978226 RepID=UPI0035AFFE63
MAVGTFPACLAQTLREEGGYSHDARDPGGATMKGVTKAVYDAYRRKQGQALRNVRLISDAELADIYRSGYWAPVGAEALAAGLDLSAFDFAVNSGVSRSKKTLAQTQGLPTAEAISRVADLRLSFLRGLSTWKTFGKGWGARVGRIEAASLKMAGAALAPIAASAQAKAQETAAKSKAALVGASGGAAAAAPMQHGALILIAILALAGVAALVFLIHSRRQAERAQALSAAAGTQLAAAAAATAQGAST